MRAYTSAKVPSGACFVDEAGNEWYVRGEVTQAIVLSESPVWDVTLGSLYSMTTPVGELERKFRRDEVRERREKLIALVGGLVGVADDDSYLIVEDDATEVPPEIDDMPVVRMKQHKAFQEANKNPSTIPMEKVLD